MLPSKIWEGFRRLLRPGCEFSVPHSERDGTAVAGAAPYVLDAMGSGVDLNQAHKPRAIHGGQLYEIADAQLLGWDLAANNGIVPCFEQPSSNRRGDCPVAEAKNLALSAWELDCLGSLTSKLQVSPPLFCP